MARPRSDINESEFLFYYETGFNDSQIAEKIGVSRMTVARKRKELNLEAKGFKGSRGLSMNRLEPYWCFVQRVFNRYPDLARSFRCKARALFEESRIDYPTYYMCMGTEPGTLSQAALPVRDSLRIFLSMDALECIMESEKNIEISSLAAVPGPAFISLVQLRRTASTAVIDDLIEESILNSGFVSASTCLGNVVKCVPYREYEQFWEQLKDEGRRWFHDTSSQSGICLAP